MSEPLRDEIARVLQNDGDDHDEARRRADRIVREVDWAEVDR